MQISKLIFLDSAVFFQKKAMANRRWWKSETVAKKNNSLVPCSIWVGRPVPWHGHGFPHDKCNCSDRIEFLSRGDRLVKSACLYPYVEQGLQTRLFTRSNCKLWLIMWVSRRVNCSGDRLSSFGHAYNWIVFRVVPKGIAWHVIQQASMSNISSARFHATLVAKLPQHAALRHL